MEEALYDTSYSSVTDKVLHNVLREEKKVLELAMESFEPVDKDDLMDLLDAHGQHYNASEDTKVSLMSPLGWKKKIESRLQCL